MRRTWLLFWHTYWTNITRRSYLVFTFGLPLFLITIPIVIIITGVLVFYSITPQNDPRPLGMVDVAQQLGDLPDEETDPVLLQAFPDEMAAQTALEEGSIQAYYVVDPAYWETGNISLTYDEPPTDEVRGVFGQWLQEQIRGEMPAPVRTRYENGATIDHQSLATDETFTERDYMAWGVVYILIYFVRSAAMFTSGYMYDSITSESRNRTIEILLTRVSVLQFVVGKLTGLLAVGLTQLGVWGAGSFFMAWLVARRQGINLIEEMLGWELLPIVIIMLFGAYVLDQLLAASAGMLRVSGGAGPQLFNMFSWLAGLGLIYAAYFVPRSPNSTIAIIASIFPATSPIVLLIRMVATEVPTWQIVASVLVLLGTIVAGIFALRALFQRNLTGYAPRFRTRQWLKARWATLRSL